MPTYNILLMGASYGSLLASKLLFGGHRLHLVCLPAEADLINAEGFRVRLPVRGRTDPVVLDSRKLPGAVTAGRAVLRLLHAKTDQVVIFRIDAGRRSSGHLAGQLARVENNRILAPAYRQAHAKTFGVDQIGFRRQADQMNRVAAKKNLGGEERAV